jgi:hypothetical protein
MDDNITLDPMTEKEFNDAVSDAFNEMVGAIDTDALEQLDYQDIAEMFFYNGFYRGCMAMTDNPDLQETIHMMAEETNYQLKEK